MSENESNKENKGRTDTPARPYANDMEAVNRLRRQLTAIGKELMFTTIGDGIASSVVVNNADDLRKIRDYMDESLRWMEA